MCSLDEAEINQAAAIVPRLRDCPQSNLPQNQDLASTLQINCEARVIHKANDTEETALPEVERYSVDQKTPPKSDLLAPRLLKGSSSLCKYCLNLINWRDYQYNKYSDHYGTKQELLESAEAGCSMCAQFHMATVSHNRFRIAEGYWIRDRDTHWCLPGSSKYDGVSGIAHPSTAYLALDVAFTLTLRMPTPSSNGCDMRGGKSASFISRTLEVREDDEKTPPEEDKDNTSRSTFDDLPMAISWLNICREGHSVCTGSISSTFTPTRLINLTDAHPRLQTFSRDEPGVPYATLSHCWGIVKRQVLTGNEFAAFHNQIPVGALSKTFLEAIKIARECGLNFIWIDSLCIIQDDIDDWRQESAMMSSVYSNSQLNISAAAAADGTKGCFFSREDTWKCQINIRSGETKTRYLCLPVQFKKPSLEGMPLMKRAWALQERLLAPRTLHCTQSQLFWECEELHACSLLPRGSNNYARTTNVSLEVELPKALDSWGNIVKDYSDCQLTMPKDKLVAVSGIARAIHSDVLGSYVAGMWRNGIESQLCWSLEGAPKSRPAKYRAPSWSWASVDGKVKISRYSYYTDFFVRVQDVVVKTATEDNPFGEVLSGVLSMSYDALLLVRVAKYDSTDSETCSIMTRDTSFYASVWPDSVGDAASCVDPAKHVYLLPLCENIHSRLIGLVLVAAGAVTGRYRRLGLFFDSRFEAWSHFQEIMLAEQGDNGNHAYARIDTDENGKQLKIIDII